MSHKQLAKLATTTLFSTGLLLIGCQPAQEEAQHDTEQAEHEHAHDEHTHDEHAHDEHTHDEHAHDEHAHDEHAHDEHAHDHHHHDHDHDHGRIIFNCEPTAKLGVFYHTDTTPKTAHILIDGIEYDFVQDSNLSEDAYISNLGLEDGKGLVWYVQQQQGDLYAVPTDMAKAGALASVSDLQKNEKLFGCQQAEAE
ncbi:hypothetical protein [Psychrobacter lutiphocae]|uniref:hypothetical protein n=1 Tax=Psychrobacter lutiphocae TaxID=540500 RepID=UPI0003792641|nr:hypothetical protein [Psychrobacter lutiphocae]